MMDNYQIEHFPQHIVANATRDGVNMQIPYDDAPFEATLLPGQQVRLYGGVEIQNDAHEAVEVLIRFDLRKGFILTIDAMETPIHIEARVAMNSHHAIQVVSETWQLIPMQRI